MILSNLIALSYAISGIVIVQKIPDDIELDLEKMIWFEKARAADEDRLERAIGTECRWRDFNNRGVIGIYDRTNLGHMQHMVQHAFEVGQQNPDLK